jgi:hypothetical protein
MKQGGRADASLGSGTAAVRATSTGRSNSPAHPETASGAWCPLLDESISILPPRCSTASRRAPIPIPRPDTSVVSVRVESPEWKRAAWRSASVVCGMPASRARSRTRSQSIPRPSSANEITSLSRRVSAERHSRPERRLPLAARSSALSTPFSCKCQIADRRRGKSHESGNCLDRLTQSVRVGRGVTLGLRRSVSGINADAWWAGLGA